MDSSMFRYLAKNDAKSVKSSQKESDVFIPTLSASSDPTAYILAMYSRENFYIQKTISFMELYNVFDKKYKVPFIPNTEEQQLIDNFNLSNASILLNGSQNQSALGKTLDLGLSNKKTFVSNFTMAESSIIASTSPNNNNLLIQTPSKLMSDGNKSFESLNGLPKLVQSKILESESKKFSGAQDFARMNMNVKNQMDSALINKSTTNVTKTKSNKLKINDDDSAPAPVVVLNLSSSHRSKSPIAQSRLELASSKRNLTPTKNKTPTTPKSRQYQNVVSVYSQNNLNNYLKNVPDQQKSKIEKGSETNKVIPMNNINSVSLFQKSQQPKNFAQSNEKERYEKELNKIKNMMAPYSTKVPLRPINQGYEHESKEKDDTEDDDEIEALPYRFSLGAPSENSHEEYSNEDFRRKERGNYEEEEDDDEEDMTAAARPKVQLSDKRGLQDLIKKTIKKK